MSDAFRIPVGARKRQKPVAANDERLTPNWRLLAGILFSVLVWVGIIEVVVPTVLDVISFYVPGA